MVGVWLMVFMLVLSHMCVLSLSGEEDDGMDCPRFPCGQLGFIRFPFIQKGKPTPPRCGFLEVDGCESDKNQSIQLERGSAKWYPITAISQGNVINISDDDFGKRFLSSNTCDIFNFLPTIPYISFRISHPKLTFFKCHPGAIVPSFLEPPPCTELKIFYVPPPPEPEPEPKKGEQPPPQCAVVELPLPRALKEPSSLVYQNISALVSAKFFSVEVTVSDDCKRCSSSGGESLTNGKHEFQCSKRAKEKLGLPIGIGICTGAFILLIVSSVFWLRHQRKPSSTVCWNIKTRDDKSIESFLRDHGCLAQRRYTYSEIKRMTRSFRDKLGEGGYGSVFKGRLPDGRLVAVKVLKEKRMNGEEFMNEVATISRTSHVNVVALLEFSVEDSKRALVYEFMSKGSLEKYIHEDTLKGGEQLGLETLYQIALCIARGLEYLHRGCNTRILHFDIKPHNILLDDNFQPKISDFGLAKLCLQRESTVSMLGTRGTPGYIAPEVFCRSFGGVSYKSDVYSYGMMLLEMVAGRKNISVEVLDNSSDVYFADWIYERLEVGEELGVRKFWDEEENQLARRMVTVSLWCIQTKPSGRPPMSRVIEMLQDISQPLTVPPRPYLSHSPPRFPQVSGSISSITSPPDEPRQQLEVSLLTCSSKEQMP